MIVPVVLGLGVGVGLWALATAVFPARPTLGALLAPATPPRPNTPSHEREWCVRLCRPAITALGLPNPRLSADLRLLELPVPVHLAGKITLAATGLLVPAVAGVVLAVLGTGTGVGVPVVGGLLLAAAGFLLPDQRVRAQAARRRSSLRHALAAYVDLIRIAVAGGAGVESALTDAAAIGRGWAFEQFRRALQAATVTRTPSWVALARLGEQLAVPQLSELAASLSLAHTEGAVIRASLAAKADTLRAHHAADAEGQAHAATERMSIPVMVLFTGFLAFITYPALTQVLNGL